ncbi:hypothetical protein G5714_005740 [Onychostoma macrolepis]|uniref:Transmembrane protein 174 n=1 Tax=Onychostoma macrolepis TaxID=369639 RepID=A0A7J6D1W3_9TELE|nr:hypothetical protein G5714_005740 [Onychostoma macrolepis]
MRERTGFRAWRAEPRHGQFVTRSGAMMEDGDILTPMEQSHRVYTICQAKISTITNSNQNPGDVPVNVVSLMPGQAPSSSNTRVSDGDKAGAMLLFSGLFLGLVGMTFTAMGWTKYNSSHSYDWTQLLGPILLSVGGPSFIFTRFNQPITLHRATVVQYIPPPYTSVVPDQSLGPVNGLHSNHQPLAVTVNTPPQYYNMHPVENPGFNSGEHEDATAEQRENRNRSVSEEEEKEEASTGDSTSSPPAYKDLFHS